MLVRLLNLKFAGRVVTDELLSVSNQLIRKCQNKEMCEIIPLEKRAHNFRSTINDKTDGYDQTLDKYLTEGEFSRCNISIGTNEHIRAIATYYVMDNCATNDLDAIAMELDTRSGSLNNQYSCLRCNNQKHVHWQRQKRYFHVTTVDIQCVNAPSISDCHVKINCAR